MYKGYSEQAQWLSLSIHISQAKNQLLPLSGATVYENVSRTGDVTYAKDPGNITDLYRR